MSLNTTVPPVMPTSGEGEVLAALTVTSLTSSRPVSTDGTKLLVSTADWSYSAATDTVYQTSLSGDTNKRFKLLADGSMSWGSGSATGTVIVNHVSTTSSAATGGPYENLRFILPSTAQTYQDYFSFYKSDNATCTFRIAQNGFPWCMWNQAFIWGGPAAISAGHIVTRGTPDFPSSCWVHELSTIDGYNLLHNNAASSAQVTAISMPNYKDYSEVTINGITRLTGSVRVGTNTAAGATAADVGDLSAGVVNAAVLLWDASAAAFTLSHTDTATFFAASRAQVTFQNINGGTGAVILGQNNNVGLISLQTGGTAKFQAYDSGVTNLMTVANQAMVLGTNNTARWQVSATGHLIASTDNSFDIGASGATRPRSIYWGTQALGPDGGVTAPTYSVANESNTGFYRGVSGTMRFASLGVAALTFGGTFISWGASGGDLFLYRAATDVLQQSRGVNAQAFRVYGTTDSDSAPVNFERLEFITQAATSLIRQTQGGTGTVRDLTIGTTGASSLIFRNANTDRARFDASTGHLLFVTDNTNDVGATGATRPRSIYFGTQTFGGVGSNTAPTYGFDTGGKQTGVYCASADADVSITINGTRTFAVQANNVQIISNTATVFMGTAADLKLVRQGADILAMNRLANPQVFRVYNTTDSDTVPVNFDRFHVGYASNILEMYSEAGGTGTVRAINFGTLGAANINFYRNTTGILILSSGGLVAGTDNSPDLGSAAARWRSGYFGTSISVGTNPAAAGEVRLPNAGVIKVRNAANSADIAALQLDANNHILVSQSTSSSVWLQSGGALATNATLGHVGIPTCAGTPTGVPANLPTGTVAIVYDTTNSKFYVYSGGWKRAQVTAVDAIYA